MTFRHLAAAMAVACLSIASVAQAHHISGTLYCDVDFDGNIDVGSDTPLNAITVRAVSQDVNPGETFSNATDVSGFYNIGLQARSDHYLVTPIGLPPGWTIVIPPGGSYLIQIITGTSSDHADNVNFLVRGCAAPPTTSSSTSSSTSTTTSSTSTSTSTTTSTTIPFNHFQCYEIKPAMTPAVTVTMADRLETASETVRYPHRLCAPADKNGEGIVDPVQHLTGYVMNRPVFKTTETPTLTNQFGTITLRISRPNVLMVPSSKSLVGAPPPLVPPTIDHFQCYKAKRARGAAKFERRTVTITDQFETESVTVVKPATLCLPADKNGEDPTAPSHAVHLLCYKVLGTTFGTIDAHIGNQFSPDDTVTLIHRRELCLPSYPQW